MFDVFDQPNASLSCERREVTTVATQALTLFNNETFLVQAQDLASSRREGSGKRPGGAGQTALPDRVQPGSERERTPARPGVHAETLSTDQAGSRDETTKLWLTPLAEFAHVVMNSNEFVYIN